MLYMRGALLLLCASALMVYMYAQIFLPISISGGAVLCEKLSNQINLKPLRTRRALTAEKREKNQTKM
jgi:hypothetical protein